MIKKFIQYSGTGKSNIQLGINSSCRVLYNITNTDNYLSKKLYSEALNSKYHLTRIFLIENSYKHLSFQKEKEASLIANKRKQNKSVHDFLDSINNIEKNETEDNNISNYHLFHIKNIFAYF